MATLRGGKYGRRNGAPKCKPATGWTSGEWMEFRAACERSLVAYRLPRVTDEERRMRRMAGEA